LIETLRAFLRTFVGQAQTEYPFIVKLPLISACIAFACSITSANAAPLNSPDTIIINGLPCNSACQAYMEWSRHASGQSTHATSKPTAEAGKRKPASKPALSRVAAQSEPQSQTKDADKSVAEKGKSPMRTSNVQRAEEVVAKPLSAGVAAGPMPAPDTRPAPEAAKPSSEKIAAVPPVQGLETSLPSAQPQTEGSAPAAVESKS
jgi:hypothetical protein